MLAIVAIAAVLITAEVLILLRESGIPAASSMTSDSSSSTLKKVLKWEGLSFVFFSTVGLTMIGLKQYDKARYFFVAAAVVLVLALFTSLDKTYPKFLVGILGAVLAGIVVNRVNDWVTGLELTQIASDARDELRDVRDAAARLKSISPGTPLPRVTKGAKPIIRTGIGPEKYKGISHEQVGKWAIDMSNKIAEQSLAWRDRTEAAILRGESRTAIKFHFTVEFTGCCLQTMQDLRTEILLRLPTAGDLAEQEAFRGTQTLDSNGNGVLDPWRTLDYAPYLRLLGVRCMRLDVKREKPKELPIKIEKENTGNWQFPYRETTTVNVNSIGDGYLVVDLVSYSTIETRGIDAPHVQSDERFIDNPELKNYTKRHPHAMVIVVRDAVLDPKNRCKSY